MITAAAKEIGDLIKIGTFLPDPGTPVNRKAVDSRIVFKVKHRADGSFDRFKARLVAKGFMQRLGFDFFSTFSPMTTLTTARTVFAIAVRHGLRINHAGVPQAFVNALLKEDVSRYGPNCHLVCQSTETVSSTKLPSCCEPSMGCARRPKPLTKDRP